MKVRRKYTALYLGEGCIKYTIQNKFKWWQRWQYVMDGRYPRLFSAEELQLLGIKPKQLNNKPYESKKQKNR